jgi:hypothetical protein
MQRYTVTAALEFKKGLLAVSRRDAEPTGTGRRDTKQYFHALKEEYCSIIDCLCSQLSRNQVAGLRYEWRHTP